MSALGAAVVPNTHFSSRHQSQCDYNNRKTKLLLFCFPVETFSPDAFFSKYMNLKDEMDYGRNQDARCVITRTRERRLRKN